MKEIFELMLFGQMKNHFVRNSLFLTRNSNTVDLNVNYRKDCYILPGR